jgi:hypothetical protein
MAMEAAETAYLAQLAADAKADAAAGYVEPWTMPASLDQFAGNEGGDDGGLYGEWQEEQSSSDAEDVYSADSSRAYAERDEVIYAEPVSGYDHLQDSSSDVADDDDFYGNGVESQRSALQLQQQAGGGLSRGGRRSEDHHSSSGEPAVTSDSGRGNVEKLVHVAPESMSVAVPALVCTLASPVLCAGESRSLYCRLKAAMTSLH